MDNVRKLAMVAGFIPQLGVRGQRRTWKNSQSPAKFQMVEQATLLGAGGRGGVASTFGRVPGSAVWYQHANSKAGSKAYERSLKKPKRGSFSTGLARVAQSQIGIGPVPLELATGVISESNEDLEQKFVRDAFGTYRKNVATYSKTLLSEINNTARLGKRDYGS